MGQLAKPVLTIAGTVLGSMVGFPGLGGVTGQLAGGAAGGLLGGAAGEAIGPKVKQPEVPQLPQMPTMPTPDSDAIAKAKQKSIAEQVSRKGRASTILTQGGLDSMGSGTKLGA